MSLEYISNNGEGDCIDINRIVTLSSHIIEEDKKPYCFIKFFMVDGTRIQWKYKSMKVRDFDLLEIRRLKYGSGYPY